MSNDNRNMILAIVLSALVLLGWGLVTQSFMPANPPPAESKNGNQVAAAQIGKRHFFPKPSFLHIGVARALMAAGMATKPRLSL